MNMNPMQLMGLLKGKNPQEMAMSMIKNSNINDPMINQLLQFVKYLRHGVQVFQEYSLEYVFPDYFPMF